MALKGQLSDFNLAEILQLIAGQQKSGFLILEGQFEMVFVFDKGVLISTRDRRSESPDPLETYLRSYGFFTADQWKHIDFIKKNSSLDLTEIIVSEQLMNEEELDGKVPVPTDAAYDTGVPDRPQHRRRIGNEERHRGDQ